MSWIGISNGRRPILAPEGGAATLLPVGSLVLEMQATAKDGARQTIVELDRRAKWRRRFRVALGVDGDLFIEHRQGGAVTIATLAFPRPDREAALRITISWRAQNRVGLATVENLDTGEMAQSVFDDPHPWPLDDIAALIRQENCRLDPTVTLLACSNRVEPVGLTAGFAAGTRIDTMAGPRRVENLKAGDLAQTSDHGMQPIRGIAVHEVPAYGRFAPIHLRAPFFGLQKDLVVAPDHRLMITGVDAEYLFGSDSVLVEARHLAKMAGYPTRTRADTITYVEVLLDAHVCLSAVGAWGESQFVGDLADHPTRHATSVLAGIPARLLPRHRRIASPELKGYEAMVLVSAMCA